MDCLAAGWHPSLLRVCARSVCFQQQTVNRAVSVSRLQPVKAGCMTWFHALSLPHRCFLHVGRLASGGARCMRPCCLRPTLTRPLTLFVCMAHSLFPAKGVTRTGRHGACTAGTFTITPCDRCVWRGRMVQCVYVCVLMQAVELRDSTQPPAPYLTLQTRTCTCPLYLLCVLHSPLSCPALSCLCVALFSAYLHTHTHALTLLFWPPPSCRRCCAAAA